MARRLQCDHGPAFGLAFALLLTAGGCAPEIGDSCNNSTDCSVDGERVCDIAQPKGYCTVRGCDPDTCPDGALCVEFRYDPQRTAETWCMKKCGGDGACRQGAGYRCVRPTDEGRIEEMMDPMGSNEDSTARIIDLERGEGKGFCAAVGAESSDSG
jgi:hypothetical protein